MRRWSPLLAALGLVFTTPAPTFAQWIPNGLAVVSAPMEQRNVETVSDGAGGMILVWEDRRDSNYDLYALRLGPDGRIASGWTTDGVIVCDDIGDQSISDRRT